MLPHNRDRGFAARVTTLCFRRVALLPLLVLGCDSTPRNSATKASVVDSTTRPDTWTTDPDTSSYNESWNLGQDLDEPRKSIDTRFAVRVKRGSGFLTVVLDSAPVSSQPGARTFFLADSIITTGLRPGDSFTRGCRIGSAPWEHRVAIVRDSVLDVERRPEFIWVIDTVNARIRPMPTDSAYCFIPSAD